MRPYLLPLIERAGQFHGGSVDGDPPAANALYTEPVLDQNPAMCCSANDIDNDNTLTFKTELCGNEERAVVLLAAALLFCSKFLLVNGAGRIAVGNGDNNPRRPKSGK